MKNSSWFRPHSLTISIFLAVMLMAAGGCSFLKPATGAEQDYVLSSEAPAALSLNTGEPAFAVRILPVEVTGYLNTRDMVVRTGANEIVFAKFHQWAEPLDLGIRRILVKNFQALHGVRDVLTDEPSPPGVKVYTVSVRILACEAKEINGQGSVLFEAAWEVSSSETTPPESLRGIFRSPSLAWRPGDYAELAKELSSAVADLTRSMDQAIAKKANGHSIL